MTNQDLSKEKLLLIEWIIRQDKLQALKSVIDHVQRMDKESSDSAKVAGYRARGLRVTASELVESIRHSLLEIEKGHTITLDQLEQESDQW